MSLLIAAPPDELSARSRCGRVRAQPASRLDTIGATRTVIDRVIATKSRTLELPAAAVIFDEGESSNRLYWLLAGRVQISQHGARRRRLVSLLGPGDMFGEAAFFDSPWYLSQASTSTAARIRYLDRDSLVDAMSESADIALAILHELSELERREDERLADRMSLDVGGRVAALLLDLGTKFGFQRGPCMHVAHGLKQFEFADLIGASRESVNKAICGFAARGWIDVEGRQITIVDRDSLARRAGRASLGGRRIGVGHPVRAAQRPSQTPRASLCDE